MARRGAAVASTSRETKGPTVKLLKFCQVKLGNGMTCGATMPCGEHPVPAKKRKAKVAAAVCSPCPDCKACRRAGDYVTCPDCGHDGCVCRRPAADKSPSSRSSTSASTDPAPAAAAASSGTLAAPKAPPGPLPGFREGIRELFQGLQLGVQAGLQILDEAAQLERALSARARKARRPGPKRLGAKKTARKQSR